MKYKIYFEIYGKKLVAEIDARNETDAEYKLRGKIQIHKIEETKSANDFGIFTEFLNMQKL